jgi:hypothetical protein
VDDHRESEIARARAHVAELEESARKITAKAEQAAEMFALKTAETERMIEAAKAAVTQLENDDSNTSELPPSGQTTTADAVSADVKAGH